MSDKVCRNCENLREHIENGYYCEITGSKIESIKQKPSWCPMSKNCHEYCRYSKYCRYHPGYNGQDPDECAMYYKIEDIMDEARDIEREQRRAREEECDDW